jgi:putative transposase
VATVSIGSTSERFEFIARHSDKFGARYLCNKLGVSKSGYYDWVERSESTRSREDRLLTAKIKRIYTASRGIYGSPRVFHALRKEGVFVGRKRVERLMREADLQARVVKVTDRHGKYKVFMR